MQEAMKDVFFQSWDHPFAKKEKHFATPTAYVTSLTDVDEVIPTLSTTQMIKSALTLTQHPDGFCGSYDL